MSQEEVPLTIGQHLLVRDAMPLVERHAQLVAWKWNRQADVDDLRSVGKLALYDAVTRFDEEVGVPFAEFASLRVYGAMLNTLVGETDDERMRLLVEREVTRYTEYYHDDFNILLHDDAELQKRLDAFKEAVLAVAFAAGIEETRCRAAEDHVANHQESTRAIAALRDAVASLERADQNVLVLLVCKKLDLQGIADELGLRHKTSAWRRVQYVLKRLREHLLAQGITRAPLPAAVEISGAGIEEWLPPDLVAMRPRRSRKELR